MPSLLSSVQVGLKIMYGDVIAGFMTFQVRSVCGKTYMLTQDEELWEKHLPNEVENLLASGRDPLADRNKRVAGTCSISFV